jgi:hypothetical protein
MANKCGAKTRASGRCRQPAMPNGRCRYHGGLSTGPKDQTGNKNRLVHGIYAKFLTEDERTDYATLKLGSVEDELRLTRIRLARALAAEQKAQGEPELDEVTKHDLIGTEGSKKDTKSKVRDYVGIIDKLTARIESLEKTRALLIELGADPDPPDSPSADRLTPGTPDEATPQNPIR